MTLRQKIAVMLVVPLLGILLLGAQLVWDKHRTALAMERLDHLAELAVQVSSLVHEAQRERGRTAGFLGSAGREFEAELLAQRQDTDARIAPLRRFLEEFDGSLYGGDFAALLETGLADLRRLGDVRRQVDELRIEVPAAIGYYTELIGHWLDVVGRMSTHAQDMSVSARINAYLNLMQVKERAGQERALLSNVLMQNAFTPETFRRFATLVAEQETYGRVFADHATAEQQAHFSRALAGKDVAEVQRLRDLAFAKASSGNFGIDPGVWFATITAKIDLLKTVEDRLAEDLQQTARHLIEAARRGFWIGLAANAGMALLAMVLGAAIAQSILRPVRHLTEAAEEIAAGNLEQTIRVTSRDEIGQLAGAFNRMTQVIVKNLRGEIDKSNLLIESVKEVIQQLSTSSNELMAISAEQSSGATQQAAAVEEVNRTLQGMAMTAKQVAEAAVRVEELAEEAGAAGDSGVVAAQDAVAGMERLKEQVRSVAGAMFALGENSQKIGGIVEIIDDISEQTNLLALNASIEAAGAGVAGKRFAVVANEVMRLATRTVAATGQIKGLVGEIQRATNSTMVLTDEGAKGVVLSSAKVERIAESLNSISLGIGETTAAAREIGYSTQQQTTATEQMVETMNEVRDVAAQVAASSEETSQAIADLTSLAERLRDLVAEAA